MRPPIGKSLFHRFILNSKYCFFCKSYRILIRTAAQFIYRKACEHVIQHFQAKFHTVFQPLRIEYTVGHCRYFFKSGQLPYAVFPILF